jgi:hypothetical protein
MKNLPSLPLSQTSFKSTTPSVRQNSKTSLKKHPKRKKRKVPK